MARINRIAVLGALCASTLHATLIKSADGQTVLDTNLDVVWAADMNLASTALGSQSQLPIGPNGAMNYNTAVNWVRYLNSIDYAGHNNWTLPNSPTHDAGFPCGMNPGPNGNDFSYGCTSSALGNLYNVSLHLNFPNTVGSPTPGGKTGSYFTNLQPYLYWSCTTQAGDSSACAGGMPNDSSGFRAFSFNTGWRGANVNQHYMYVLPMAPGNPFNIAVPNGSTSLQSNGTAVYDPVSNVTWLANADLAMQGAGGQNFGLCWAAGSLSCINPDGSMSNALAEQWITNMDNYDNGPGKLKGWLGISTWQLPSAPDDSTCSLNMGTFGYNCSGSNDSLGELYYSQLNLAGNPSQKTPNIDVGPFTDVQPYLYWSCGFDTPQYCLGIDTPPNTNMEWSFSFGNGFEGTDFIQNDLYVEVYAPVPEPASLAVISIGLAAVAMYKKRRRLLPPFAREQFAAGLNLDTNNR